MLNKLNIITNTLYAERIKLNRAVLNYACLSRCCGSIIEIFYTVKIELGSRMTWTQKDNGILTYEDFCDNNSVKFIFQPEKAGYIQRALLVIVTQNPSYQFSPSFRAITDTKEEYPLNGLSRNTLLEISHNDFEVMARIKGKTPVSTVKLSTSDYECTYELEGDWEQLYLNPEHSYQFCSWHENAKSTKLICDYKASEKWESRSWMKPFQLGWPCHHSWSNNHISAEDLILKRTIVHSQDPFQRAPNSYYLLYPNNLEIVQINYVDEFSHSQENMVFYPEKEQEREQEHEPGREQENNSSNKKGIWITKSTNMRDIYLRPLQTTITVEFRPPFSESDFYNIELYGIVPTKVDPLR